MEVEPKPVLTLPEMDKDIVSPKEHFQYLLDEGYSPQELTAVHGLAKDIDGVVFEIEEDEIASSMKGVYDEI